MLDMKAFDAQGRRFGRLVGVRRAPNQGKETMWLFRCDCGVEVTTHLGPVKYGRVVSCGCRPTEARHEKAAHGHTVGRRVSPELSAYRAAKSRCCNPRNAAFHLYGGRGIGMCQRWQSDFGAFYQDMGPRPSGTSLDRIDNSRGYHPGNCRWATIEQQANNKRSNVFVDFGGETLTLAQFARKAGINYKTMHTRISTQGETAIEAARALGSPLLSK